MACRAALIAGERVNRAGSSGDLLPPSPRPRAVQKPHPAKSQTATHSSKKCTLDEGPCKADSCSCGAFEELPLCMVTQSPAPPKDGAFFAPGNRLVASVCFAAAKLSPKANSRATAARWRQERPGPDKQRPKSQSAKLDLCPTPMANLGPYAH